MPFFTFYFIYIRTLSAKSALLFAFWGQRYLPLNTPLLSEIIDIIKDEKNKRIISISNTHNVLFWDYRKDTFVTPSAIKSYLDRLEAKYHILDEDDNEKLTSHRMRHYAITHWMKLGIPMNVIQYLAGHVEGSNITNETYIDTSLNFVKDTLNKIS